MFKQSDKTKEIRRKLKGKEDSTLVLQAKSILEMTII